MWVICISVILPFRMSSLSIWLRKGDEGAKGSTQLPKQEDGNSPNTSGGENRAERSTSSGAGDKRRMVESNFENSCKFCKMMEKAYLDCYEHSKDLEREYADFKRSRRLERDSFSVVFANLSEEFIDDMDSFVADLRAVAVAHLK